MGIKLIMTGLMLGVGCTRNSLAKRRGTVCCHAEQINRCLFALSCYLWVDLNGVNRLISQANGEHFNRCLRFGKYNYFLLKTATPRNSFKNFTLSWCNLFSQNNYDPFLKPMALGKLLIASVSWVDFFINFLKLNKEIAFLFSRVLRCSLFFECTKSFQTIHCRYNLRKQMLKISASRNYEVLFVLAALFFKFCSLFFVMGQNVKRRLVVRSNDERRHSTMIFSENVAVTEELRGFVRIGGSLF